MGSHHGCLLANEICIFAKLDETLCAIDFIHQLGLVIVLMALPYIYHLIKNVSIFIHLYAYIRI